MKSQESRDGNLPAGNVHELPVIYLKNGPYVGRLDALFLLFPLNRLILSTVFSLRGTNVRIVGREKPLEASQIKVGVFSLWCFIHGKKGAVLAS